LTRPEVGSEGLVENGLALQETRCSSPSSELNSERKGVWAGLRGFGSLGTGAFADGRVTGSGRRREEAALLNYTCPSHVHACKTLTAHSFHRAD